MGVFGSLKNMMEFWDGAYLLASLKSWFEILLMYGLVVIPFMVLGWLWSLWRGRADHVDMMWGLGFVLMVWSVVGAYSFLQWSTPEGIRGVPLPAMTYKYLLFAGLVTLWGGRLAGYIALRGRGKPEDWRYANWRRDWGKHFWWRSLLQIFLLQGLIMLVMGAPLMMEGTRNLIFLGDEMGVSGMVKFWLGGGLALGGILFEAVADWQLYTFKQKPENKGQVLDAGLWGWSRHPNYFGEIVIWWGLWVMVGGTVGTVLSPLLITFLLVRVSGVAMTERRYAGDDDYSRYKRRVSALVPWWPKKQAE